MGRFVSLLRGCFPVGEFYLREVLSHNSTKVASFYQAIFEIFFSQKWFERENFSFNEAFLHIWWVTQLDVHVLKSFYNLVCNVFAKPTAIFVPMAVRWVCR